MITGTRRTQLTIDNVLQRISAYDIFRYYMGSRKWKLNEATLSPFREEENPSFVIGNRNGYLSFIDFTTSSSGDCFTFVKLLYNINSMDEVLKKIDSDFGLGISSIQNVGNYKIITGKYKQPEIELGKRYSVIQCITRKFTKEELAYWAEYYQDINDLRENSIYSLSKVYLNRQLFPLKDGELRFGYLIKNSYWKLYFPYASKKKKWLSNVPLNTAYGLENLSKDKNTLIVDSLKDHLVCRKIYNNVVQVQNESISSISTETVEFINNNSKTVFVGFDADAPGKNASRIITQMFNWKHINTPDYLLPEVKDWAGMGKALGLDAIKNHFIKKGLI